MGNNEADFDAFDGIQDAQETFLRNYLKVNGTTVGSSAAYLLEIKNVVFRKNRKKIDFFAVEFIVRGSNCPEVKIGDAASYYTSADKDPFKGNVKNFAAAAISAATNEVADPNTITKEIMMMLVKDGGDMVRGAYVNCACTLVQTGGGTGTFTRHVFSAGTAPAAPAAA